MYNSLSPFSFFYFTLYFSFLSILFCSDNFLFFWLIMEFMTLLLIGFSFSLFSNSFSYLMVYFLIQSVSSFSILLFYLLSYFYIFLVFLLIKLSMFPFHMWYMNVVYRFPFLPFFFVSTVHKIPSFIMVPVFSIPLNSFFMFCLAITVFFASLHILSSSDFRMLLVSSSVGNNSWLFLSSLVSFDFFLFYLFIYSFNFYLILLSISPFSSVSYFSSASFNSMTFLLWLISISGLPPFPMFFLNVAVLYTLVSYYPLTIFFSVFFTFIMVSSYVISSLKLLVYRFSNPLFPL